MRGYKCDRCGQWYSGNSAGYLYALIPEKGKDDFKLDCKTYPLEYDFCPECSRSVISCIKNLAITSD